MFQEFAKNKKLKHAGDPDVRMEKESERELCGMIFLCLVLLYIDLHQRSSPTHSPSSPVSEGAEQGKYGHE